MAYIGEVISTIPQQGESSMSTPQEQVPIDENLFDPNFDLDDDEGLDDDEEEFDEDELEMQAQQAQAAAEVVLPELPAILFYDSESHGHRRFYQHSLKGKPEWAAAQNEAFVFNNADHLRLAGMNCKAYGYNGLNFETVT